LLRPLYDRVLQLSSTRWALPTLAVTAFAEASFFPLPPDILLGPMVLARRERAWLYAGVCSLASVLGALLGYAIGVWATPLGLAILKLFGHAEGLDVYKSWFAQNGFVVILIKGLTPIPFKLITIASGLARFDLVQFTAACAITRSGRFFLEAALLQHPQAKAFVDRHLWAIAGAGVAAILAAVVALKFLHA
jgi:membrane protein YqaA with SNARE-associated domain